MTIVKTIKATEVRKGHTVTMFTYRFSKARRSTPWEQELKKTDDGQWPTVVEVDHSRCRESGHQMVYLRLSSGPGIPAWIASDARYRLYPDDEVTVEVTS